MSLTYLDQLPGAAQRIVVRHLSSNPKKISWTKYVQAEDALNAMHPFCPLSIVARSSFTGINHGDMTSLKPSEVRLSREQTPVLAEWLQVFRELLFHLTLNSALLQGDHDFGNIKPKLELLRGNCLGPRRLDIRHLSSGLPDSLLWATIGRLRELTASQWVTSGIDQNCIGLRKLVLYSSSHECPVGEMNKVWHLNNLLLAAGPTLETIKIHLRHT